MTPSFRLLGLLALAALLPACDAIVRPGDSGTAGGGSSLSGQDSNSGDGGSLPGVPDDDDDGGGSDRPPRTCGQGPYLFTISTSDTDPLAVSGRISPDGATPLWLWKAEGLEMCALEADFEVIADAWTDVVFSPVYPHVNVTDEAQVYLGLGEWLPEPQLLGAITVYGRPDTLRMRLTAQTPDASAVTCCGAQWPVVGQWFTAGSDSAGG